jgi:hypothetical protein
MWSVTVKLVMTLLVRDEEDIVDANIEFHLANGVDFIIATDNLSVDRTPEILRHYERSGKLLYLRQDEDDYSQFRWVTQMARRAATEFGADWVINNDADEFWWTDHGTLKDTLAAVALEYDAVVVQRTNFVPRPVREEIFFADAMTIRETVSLNALGHPLPPKVCHRGFADVEIEQGNHSVARGGFGLRRTAAPIEIFHFPLRTFYQFENKISKGGAAVRRNILPELVPTWLRLLQVYESGGLAEFYDGMIPSEETVAIGLSDGRYIRDERLRNRLAQLRDKRVPGSL